MALGWIRGWEEEPERQKNRRVRGEQREQPPLVAITCTIQLTGHTPLPQ